MVKISECNKIKLKKQIYLIDIGKILLFFTIISSFFGPSFLFINIGAFNIFPYRFLVPSLVLFFFIYFLLNGGKIFLLKNGKIEFYNNKVEIYLFFLLAWVIYSFTTLIWANAKIEVVTYSILLLMGTSLCFFITLYFYELKYYKRMFNIWIMVLLVFVLIGFWNYFTGEQLKVSRLYNATKELRYVPTAVFHNQNDFATYIVISIPFLITYIKYQSIYKKIVGFIILMASIYLLLVTLSRASMLAFVFGFCLWFVLMTEFKLKLKITTIIVILLLIMLIFIPEIISQLSSQYLQQLASLIDSSNNSNNIRINLIKNGIFFLINSYGFGVGAGNAEYSMENFYIYDIQGILNLHNWWAEILVNFGIIIFLGYLMFFFGLLLNLYKMYRILDNKDEKMICEALIVSFVVFIIASTSPSSIIGFNPHWILMGTALGFLNYLRLKKERVA